MYNCKLQIFDAFTDWLDSTHRYRLRAFEHAPLIRFNDMLMRALRRKGFMGTAIPIECLDDAGFWDGSRWSIKCPSAPYCNQARWYNRKYRHNMGVLSFMGMDFF